MRSNEVNEFMRVDGVVLLVGWLGACSLSGTDAAAMAGDAGGAASATAEPWGDGAGAACGDMPCAAESAGTAAGADGAIATSGGPVPSFADAGPALEPACAALAGAALVREVTSPGPGAELDVRFLARDPAVPAPSGLASCMTLRDAVARAQIPTAVAERSYEAAFTLLLVAAGEDAAASERAVAAAAALIAARPAGERIAVFRWAEQVVQIDTFLTDRDRLLAQLTTRLGTRTADLLPLEQAIAAVHDDLAKVERDAVAALRTLLVIAPELDASAVAIAEEPGDPLLVAGLFGAAAAADVAKVAARMDAELAAGFYSLGYCGEGAERAVLLELRGGAPELAFNIKDNLDEELDGPCDAAAIAAGEREFADTFHITFSADERAAYEREASMQLQDDFTGLIQLSSRLRPTPMTIHLHGETSLQCARKSFTIDLDRDRGRHLFPASSTDEVQLILTCQDPYYIHQLTANELLQQRGLFPLRARMVELTIDGQSNGSYLLVEKNKEEIVHDFSRVTAVIRRRNDALDLAPEVKFTATDEAGALAQYAQILPPALNGLSGAELERRLREHMDLDRYLEWVALLSLLGTGDYVDELIWYATETYDPATGTAQSFFTPMAWDTDGAFSECHYLGVYAIADPHGLLYCTESDFDRFIFADSHLYARYVDVLERVIAFADDTRFAQAIAQAKAALDPLLAREAVRAADVEFRDWAPGATTRDDFTRAIDGEAARMAAALRDNRATLTRRIADYRARQP